MIALKKIHTLITSLLLILVLTLFFNSTLTGKTLIVTPDFGLSDILHDGLPSKTFLAHSIAQKRLLFWNPFIGTGYPLEGYPTGMWYPLNSVLFAVFPVHLGLHWGLFLSLFILGLGTYIFVRNISLRFYSSLLIVLTVCLSGTIVVQMNHYPVIQSFSLFPWLLLSFHNYYVRKKVLWGLLFSLCIGLSISIGFYQITLYSLTIIWMYAVGSFVKTAIINRNVAKNYLFLLCGLAYFTVIGIGLGAIQLVPSIQLLSQSIRQSGVNDLQRFQFPFPVKHFFTFLYPYILGDPRVGTYPPFSEEWGIFWENTGYIGIIPLLLICASIFIKGNRKRVVFWSICVSIFALLILGKKSPTKFLFEIPPFSFFRIPSRFLFFMSFALSIMAGYGFQTIVERYVVTKRIKRIIILGILLITSIDMLWFGMNYHLRGQSSSWLAKPETVSFLEKDTSWYRVVSFGESPYWNNLFLKRGWKNVGEAYIPLLASLKANYNVFYSVNQFNQYEALPTKRGAVQRQIVATVDQGRSVVKVTNTARTLLDLSGVKYFLAPVRIESQGITLETSTKTQPPIHIYKNVSAFPRVWIVNSYTLFNETDITKYFVNSEILKSTVFVEEPLEGIDSKANGTVTVIKDELDSIELSVSISATGIVVLADAYDPGWKAFVDGEETNIYPANINQRAIIVSPGNHKIHFVYKPESFRTGVIISLISGLVFLISFIILKKVYTN